MNLSNKNGYLLLLAGNASYQELSLEEIQELINRNRIWLDRLATQGKIKACQALARTGVTIAGKGRIISDGPFAESKEAIGGYLLLDVETLDEAVAIAKTSPILDCGTSIEVRPVAEECPLDTCARELAQVKELASANA